MVRNLSTIYIPAFRLARHFLQSGHPYDEEIDYIFFKWNLKEVLKFEQLAIIELDRLCQNPRIGIIKNDKYSILFSKQTTLFYNVKEKEETIELLLFWNNQKNPEELNKLL